MTDEKIKEEMTIEDNESKEKRMTQKLQWFFDNKIKVHVELKDKIFLNGMIIEKKGDGVFIMDEVRLGHKHIFASDVYKIDGYQDKPIIKTKEGGEKSLYKP